MSVKPCQNCGEPITLKPHPMNPQRFAPFDQDGEIHFATCKNKKKTVEERKIYRTFESLPSPSGCSFEGRIGCDKARYVFSRTLDNGAKQLVAMCGNGHCRAISHIPEHFALQNISDEEGDKLLAYIRSSYGRQAWRL